ncbi:alkene reductase [Streptomyces sp. 3MP-14]|uniref:Alkene reductase n=1 Tax=Streptomyces mimosae TaxID=2586635 RepID=A0A5N6AA09_9ACTN|nr:MULTISPECIES: alkene reductase [Streptomyces]KAB8164669.1 alkene reductase [Streptomyces mimosae]KAB8175585.1 alkene reductase [Streptomyces sp. 3MP-14]
MTNTTANATLLAPYSPRHSPGGITLPNRLVMAPMTRYRGTEDGRPQPIVATYYAQRASAGLIVTEGLWPSARGQSGWRIPGLATAEHAAAWRAVTDAVHAAGGRIFAQLMHGGRLGHPEGRIDGSLPAGPSIVTAPEKIVLRDGSRQPAARPREMTEDDIDLAVADHVTAAQLAVGPAGFDGVEIHGANSYLSHQFLADNTNLRTDRWGGSPANRRRFPLRLVRAVADAVGGARVALRLSPGNPQFGMAESDPGPVYRPLVEALNELGLAYLHLTDNDRYPALADLRPRWSGTLVANVGENGPPTTREQGEALVSTGRADLVSYGRAFLANPDLPARFAAGAELNEVDPTHLYGWGPEGYTDYPSLPPAV